MRTFSEEKLISNDLFFCKYKFHNVTFYTNTLPIPVPDGPDGPLGPSISSTEFSSSKSVSKGKLSLFDGTTLLALLFDCSGATCNPNPGLSVTC